VEINSRMVYNMVFIGIFLTTFWNIFRLSL